VLRGPHSGPVGWAHFREPLPEAEATGLWVNSVGEVRDRGVDAVLAHRTLGCHCALLVARGRAWFESAPTGRRELAEGTLVWIFPDVEHSYAPLTEQWLERWIQFDGPLAERLDAMGHLDRRAPFAEVGTDARIAGIFDRARDGFLRETPEGELLAAAAVLELLGAAGALATSRAAAEGSRDPLVRRALALVDARADDPDFTPEHVARRLRVPYSTLRRRLRQAGEGSLKARILRARMTRAKQLLGVTTLSVEEVAYRCGFRAASYFVRAFREREGVTPGEFRRRQGRLEGPG
ncbi:MAG: AraC family transcriptional regulator, partial [Deltaproteobacteria bacterium]|nr:AraC family transcriptional regulator [Deltaproteobacteria bacterium]